MNSRLFALFGVAAAILFFGSLFVVGGMMADYSHSENTVNLLLIGGGNLAIAYSLFGFIMPGLLLVGLGAGLHVWLKAHKLATSSALLTMLWGGFLAVAGAIPPEGGDFLGPRDIIHSGAMLLSGLFFLTAAGLFAANLWDRSREKVQVYVSVALSLLFLAVFFSGAGLGTGLAQRIGFAAQFGWAIVVATVLWRTSSGAVATAAPESTPPPETAPKDNSD